MKSLQVKIKDAQKDWNELREAYEEAQKDIKGKVRTTQKGFKKYLKTSASIN